MNNPAVKKEKTVNKAVEPVNRPLEPHPDDLRPPEIEAGPQRYTAERRPNPRAEAEKLRERGGSGHERIPLGGQHQKLSVRDYGNQLAGFKARWFRDSGTRIQNALNAGYVPVYREGVEIGDGDDYNPDKSTWVCTHGGTHAEGQPRLMYLMKIREAWYREDQAAKQQQVDEVDKAIRGDGITPQEGDTQNRYVKQADYSINSRR